VQKFARYPKLAGHRQNAFAAFGTPDRSIFPPSETDGSFLLLPQVILEMSLSQKLSCLIQGVQSKIVAVILEFLQLC